ncbi:hypothetical protein AAG570_001041 [Ranatra chinensis]|uniref:Uncharacterized protein n=1 Tax=Ranatra chinensis TaxID=642074 RepID=A0ABD0YAZ3_9HEMI
MASKRRNMFYESKKQETAEIASRIRYEITSGNIGGAFAVKNMTGAIYVAGALDYETRKRAGRRLEVFTTGLITAPKMKYRLHFVPAFFRRSAPVKNGPILATDFKRHLIALMVDCLFLDLLPG